MNMMKKVLKFYKLSDILSFIAGIEWKLDTSTTTGQCTDNIKIHFFWRGPGRGEDLSVSRGQKPLLDLAVTYTHTFLLTGGFTGTMPPSDGRGRHSHIKVTGVLVVPFRT